MGRRDVTQGKNDVIDIHFQSARRHPPGAVLVFPFLTGEILWIRHRARGWEVPGGKVEPGESPDQTAARELREEAGATLDALEWLGEYALAASDGTVTFKWVYAGLVRDVGARTSGEEIVDVRIWRPSWTPATARLREDVSFIMKDAVYERLWPHLENHPWRRLRDITK